jgi:hypothetical protein
MEAQQLNLEPGRVYRTKDLAHWDKNTPRLAKKLVKSGRLVRVRQGLFAAPKSNAGRLSTTLRRALAGVIAHLELYGARIASI